MDFSYDFFLNAEYSAANIKAILDCASGLGYSFHSKPWWSKDFTPEGISAAEALSLAMHEKEGLKGFFCSINLHHDQRNLEFAFNNKDGSLVIGGGYDYFETYGEALSYMQRMIEILRPFKINLFQVQEEYFMGTPIPTPLHDGPIIFGNRYGLLPALKQSIHATGFKILDKPEGQEIQLSLKEGEGDYDYDMTVYLKSDETAIKAQINAFDISLMPLKPYKQFNYQDGPDIDTAFYLDLFFKIAEGSEALDYVEAKNFEGTC